jgi:hypothetical protein
MLRQPLLGVPVLGIGLPVGEDSAAANASVRLEPDNAGEPYWLVLVRMGMLTVVQELLLVWLRL